MKRKRETLAACLLLLLLYACAAPGPSQPDGPDPSPTPVEGTQSEEPGPAAADFSAQVFDPTQDSGRLTVRYLRLTRPYKSRQDSAEASVTTGDSAVYTSPEGKIMLVDCGNPLGGEEVVEQLNAMDVEQLDIVVLSHPHADHIGGFPAVADAFPIHQVYMNGHEYDSGTYRSVLEKIEEKGIPVEILKEGDTFSFGEQVQAAVYGPPEGASEQVAGGFLDANDCSIALRLTYGDSSFWTAGDLYVPREQTLADTYGEELHSDVVKMDHHGKDTSNVKAYVEALSPKIAVGLFDSVGSRTVAMRYQAAGAAVFYNCADGAVRVSTAGDGTYEVQTQLLRDLAILPPPAPDGRYVIS